MRHRPLGFKQSLAGRRQLCCEQLEHRALLTALIASAEIAPGPIDEFSMQAESFVNSTLEHVQLTLNQTRGKTTKTTQTELTEDGRLVRISNYTVELNLRPQSPLQVVGGTSVPTGSLAVTMPPLATRSNLVFSFMIYTDNTVSIRAKLNNPPQWAGFAATNFDLQERFRMRSSSNETTQAQSSLASVFTTYGRDGLNRYATTESAQLSATNADADSHLPPADQVAERDANSLSEAHPLDSLLGQMIVIEFGGESAVDRSRQGAQTVEPCAASADSAAGRSLASESSAHELPAAAAADDHALPIPRGMIQLHFTQIAGLQPETAIANLPASAIYQVFVDSSAPSGLDAVAERGEIARLSAPAEVLPAEVSLEEVEPSRWRTTTLALASLVGGLVWGLRPQRGRQEGNLQATS